MTVSRVKVKVLGREYTVKSSADQDYMEEIAKYINKKTDELADKFSNLNREQIIILAAINVADELFQLYQLIDQDKEQRGDS